MHSADIDITVIKTMVGIITSDISELVELSKSKEFENKEFALDRTTFKGCYLYAEKDNITKAIKNIELSTRDELDVLKVTFKQHEHDNCRNKYLIDEIECDDGLHVIEYYYGIPQINGGNGGRWKLHYVKFLNDNYTNFEIIYEVFDPVSKKSFGFKHNKLEDREYTERYNILAYQSKLDKNNMPIGHQVCSSIQNVKGRVEEKASYKPRMFN